MNDLPQRVIWINGLPRSGTSWLSQIVDSSQEVEFRMAPLFSFQFRNSIKPGDTEDSWKRFFSAVYNSTDEWMSQKDRRQKGAFPTFTCKLTPPPFLAIKDVRHHQFLPHLLKLNLDLRVLHIIRDPRAAIYSWLNNTKEYPQEADRYANWRSGEIRKVNENEFWGFNDWMLLTKQYETLRRNYPDRVFVVRYEELVLDPISRSKEIFAHLGLEFLEQTTVFLKNSTTGSSRDPFSVFKNKDVLSNWKQNLEPAIAKEIEEELIGTGLEKYLFDL